MLRSKLLQFHYEKIHQLRESGNKSTKDYEDLNLYIDTFFTIYDGNYDGSITEFHGTGGETDLYVKVMEELAIMAFYLNRKMEGLISIDRLLMSNISSINRVQAIGNIPYYINILSPDVLKLRLQMHFGNIDSNFNHMNYSILPMGDYYIALIRYTNYSIDLNTGSYTIRGPGIYSKSILAKISGDLEVISTKEVKDLSGLITYTNTVFRGMEDSILFEKDSDIWFSCVSLESNPEEFLPQINVCKMNSEYDVIVRLPVASPTSGQEKNWLPIPSQKDKLSFYRCGYGSDFTIQEIDVPAISQTVNTKSLPIKYEMNFSRFKGSAGPLKFGDGYLYLFHESIVKPQRIPSYYYNRFAYTDIHHKILMLSLPCKFDSCPTEFCRSMCYNIKDPHDIIFTVSIGDASSWIYILDVDYIKTTLHDLKYFQL